MRDEAQIEVEVGLDDGRKARRDPEFRHRAGRFRHSASFVGRSLRGVAASTPLDLFAMREDAEDELTFEIA